jgi:hypothetical protein
LARRFPTLGFERQRKVAATSFYRAILEREGPAMARQMGDPEALIGLGILDADRTRRFLTEAFTRGGKDLHRAWHLINLEMWARPYVN